MSDEPTLLVGTYETRCSVCRRGADPSAETHERAMGYGEQPPGCGVRWTHIRSTYYSEGTDARIAAMRPDLVLVPSENLGV